MQPNVKYTTYPHEPTRVSGKGDKVSKKQSEDNLYLDEISGHWKSRKLIYPSLEEPPTQASNISSIPSAYTYHI